jgi:hypothetical protein
MTGKTNGEYEVLSPWAEVEPIAQIGISPRVPDLAGKRVGLYLDAKRAAEPILNVVEARLKEKFPAAGFSRFANLARNEEVVEQDIKAEFEDWVKGVDAVVTAFGD